MKKLFKKTGKNNKGITLMTLIITIIILIILSSVSVYTGISTIRSSKFTKFIAELKIMQTHVNEIYQKYTDGGSIDVGGNTYTGDEILNIGKDIAQVTDKANIAFTSAGSGITDRTGYKYFDQQTIKDLNIEGVEEEFFINIQKRSIISCEGFEYENKMYYTLDQIPSGFYNVEYEENTNKPTFDIVVESFDDSKLKVTVSNIKYNGYISKWQVNYKIEGQDYWSTSEELSFIVTEEGVYDIYIGNGNVTSDIIGKTIIVETKPFIPDGAEVTNDNLDTGFTIKDKNENEWVWIEVPRSIYTNTEYNGGTAPTSSEDYAKIEEVMQEYAKDYRESGFEDTWYSKAQHGFISATDYNNHKNSMLKSVYENGGFYIGKYEIGIKEDTYRAYGEDYEEEHITTGYTPVIQEDKYVYNWVRCNQAQELSESLATGGKTSSLMFGIQWDLVLKHIETKQAKTQDELKNDSKDWGNYLDASFDITKGKYSEDKGAIYKDVGTESYTKIENDDVLLTTGATERNSVLNIYDLAGNVWEWTLEYTTGINFPCVLRGGGYSYSGYYYPVSGNSFDSTTYSDNDVGFRPALW